MIRTFTFVKDPDNRWYAVLPEWEGDRWELEMVMGSDMMLDILAQGESPIEVNLSTEPFKGSTFTLTYKEPFEDGAYYDLKGDLFEFIIWLCHVTSFVYGELPKKLYISR